MRTKYLVQVHGTEVYVDTPKSTIAYLRQRGLPVHLDKRFTGIVYIEVGEPSDEHGCDCELCSKHRNSNRARVLRMMEPLRRGMTFRATTTDVAGKYYVMGPNGDVFSFDEHSNGLGSGNESERLYVVEDYVGRGYSCLSPGTVKKATKEGQTD